MRRRFTARLLPSAALLLLATTPALAQAPQAPQGGMPPMDHSRMQGMDHSRMQGMDHSRMPGMGRSGMAPGGSQHPLAAQQGETQRPAQPSDRTQAPRN